MTRRLTLVSLVLAGLMALPACQTKAQTGAAVGAGVGAVGGAIIGHQSGNRTKGAAIGAAAGALGGYVIGNEMDKSDQNDQPQIQETAPPR